MGLFSNIGEFLFGKKPDAAGAQSALTQGKDAALSNMTMGLNQAQGTLQPTINRGNQYQDDIQNLLMGKTNISSIPGFNAMSDARRDAVSDLGTGMAGTGKFFSGTTADRAADIGGSMQNQFLQQYLNNLVMGAQPGQQATNQLAGFQMGTGTNMANTNMVAGSNMGNMIMADQSDGAFGDILGAAASLGGAYMGSKSGDE